MALPGRAPTLRRDDSPAQEGAEVQGGTTQCEKSMLFVLDWTWPPALSVHLKENCYTRAALCSTELMPA